MSLRLSVQKSSSADGASINVKLQCLDRIIYNPPLPNQPTETFRCLLHRKNASNPLLARIRLHLLTRISIIIHIFSKFTIFKSFQLLARYPMLRNIGFTGLLNHNKNNTELCITKLR